MITGKLDTGLITDGPKKLKELKFTDYSINKFQGHNPLYFFPTKHYIRIISNSRRSQHFLFVRPI